MCGRYELHSHPMVLALQFGLGASLPDLVARYNIAPQTDVPIVRIAANGERELVRVRWGLVPFWAKEASIGAKMINARGETVREKPAFRNAFRRQRCLIPADAFYEWARTATRKQPWRFHAPDGALLGFAGLWEHWRDPDGRNLETCAIVTTGANAVVAPVHDRMPVIVPRERYHDWLGASVEAAAALIGPCPESMLAGHPVSMRVNSSRSDDAALIEPVSPADLPRG